MTVLTNSRAVAEHLDKECCGGHRHVHLVNGRAKTVRGSTDDYCDNLLKGVMVELQASDEKQIGTNALQDSMCDPDEESLLHSSGDPLEKAAIENNCPQARGVRDPKKVREARQVELRTFEEAKVYEYACMEDALQTPGAIILDTTWVDQQKDGGYKSRL